jgi:hypothetical protein
MEGRTVNLTLTPEGQAVTQGTVDRALATVTGLVQYQVLQTGPAAYLLRLVGEEAQSDRVTAAAGEALQAVYGPAAAITVEAVEAIAPDPPGKYRLAKPLDPINPDTLLDERYAPRLS